PVNDAPSATAQTVTTNEDTDKTITLAGDDGDPELTQTLTFKVSTLPGKGTLYQTTDGVTRGTAITTAGTTVSDSLNRIIFAPAGNENGSPYTTFKFTVTDDATAGGAALTSAEATMTMNVTSVNDAPSGANNTVTTLEDQNYTFGVVDFGFSDPNDSPANALLAVKITTLPAAGTLKDNGVAVTAGQFIPVADITGNLLKFCPASNANGNPYASF